MVRRLVPALALFALLGVLAACSSEEKTPIVVAQDRITVINLSGVAWSSVEVWLNDHYRVQVSGLEAGQRLDVPIGVFVAGFGQRFDPKRQVPFGVEVSARGADGRPVRLIWGKGRRR
jgi:hypothetical protein